MPPRRVVLHTECVWKGQNVHVPLAMPIARLAMVLANEKRREMPLPLPFDAFLATRRRLRQWLRGPARIPPLDATAYRHMPAISTMHDDVTTRRVLEGVPAIPML